MSDKIFIVGHKSPDLDSAAAAIMYADLKNKIENTDKYIPALSGEINKETRYALKKFGFEEPEVINDASGKELILVDHNEKSQSPDRIEEAKIKEILDHHKIDFSYDEPIKINIEAWGASCSIIADMYFKNNIDLNAAGAGLLLSAILIDTVISKSPTCTKKDMEIMDKLSLIAGIDDWRSYGMELFKVRSDVSDMSDLEVLKSDYKDFDFGGKKFGIGQVETVDLSDLKDREDSILKEIKNIKERENYYGVILFITDIIEEGSLFLVVTEKEEDFEKIFGQKLVNNRVYIDGIISRKKQVVPKITSFYS